MKFLIIGKKFTGKREIRDELQSVYDWNVPLPITSRPRMNPFDDEFTFISQEEMDAISENEILIRTKIDDTDCIILKNQINHADAIVVIPEEIETITKAFPNEWFSVINIEPYDENARIDIATRYEDGKKDMKTILENDDAEHKDAFDKVKASKLDTALAQNCRYIGNCTQKYTSDSVAQIANAMVQHKRVVTKLSKIMTQLGDAGITTTNGNQIEIIENDESEETSTRHIEDVTEALVITRSASILDAIIKWLELEDSYIPDINLVSESKSNETPVDD